MIVSWFSAGVSSAVATKLVIDEVDKIIYNHIDDQHEDTMRFVKDCEQWFGKEIEIAQSVYKDVDTACRGWGGENSKGFIRSVRGFAPCTELLKRRVRKEWEYKNDHENHTYIWGMDCNEANRFERLSVAMPNQKHRCPLIEQSISKAHAHEILKANGLKRPIFYDMGYHNQNCLGCIKGGMGYFNKIRRDFPEVFAKRAKMERDIGASCIKGVFLDELDPERGRHDAPIVEDCGIMCELMKL